jgi:hypothetical protein
MNHIWDVRADAKQKGDDERKISPEKIYEDERGKTHYVFKKAMFNNPWYEIPQDDYQLFRNFLKGGSRSYPSDGNIPCDIVADEVEKIINKVVKYSENLNSIYHEEAKNALQEGKESLFRGTVKIYLGKYTSRDWRRKRFTDDIDFWTFHINLLDAALRECGFKWNKKSKEWEKGIMWKNPKTGETRNEVLYAANNLSQLLDFGAGSYLEGASLKEVFLKKLKRGHDVDLSDIINVVMVNSFDDVKDVEEWRETRKSFEEAANTRNTRTISNMISLCRYSMAIAEHSRNVSKAIEKYHEEIYDETKYPDEEIKSICNISVHWQNFLKMNGIDATREMIHNFLVEQIEEKRNYAKNLETFTHTILELLNSKFKHQNVVFELEQ